MFALGAEASKGGRTALHTSEPGGTALHKPIGTGRRALTQDAINEITQ